MSKTASVFVVVDIESEFDAPAGGAGGPICTRTSLFVVDGAADAAAEEEEEEPFPPKK